MYEHTYKRLEVGILNKNSVVKQICFILEKRPCEVPFEKCLWFYIFITIFF
jgi:hypothetical protein